MNNLQFANSAKSSAQIVIDEIKTELEYAVSTHNFDNSVLGYKVLNMDSSVATSHSYYASISIKDHDRNIFGKHVDFKLYKTYIALCANMKNSIDFSYIRLVKNYLAQILTACGQANLTNRCILDYLENVVNIDANIAMTYPSCAVHMCIPKNDTYLIKTNVQILDRLASINVVVINML